MKISAINAVPLVGSTSKGGWSNELNPDDSLHTLIEVVTDTGVTGIGSVFTSAAMVEASLQILNPLFIGESALEGQCLREKAEQSQFWRGRGGAMTHTLSGIDIALWDILGKHCNQSVGVLLGGRYRDKIKPYASILFETPDKLEAVLAPAIEHGFQGVKLGWGQFGRESAALDEAMVKKAREILGDRALMVDAGGSDGCWAHGYKWALNTSEMLKEYNVAWFEEPLRPDDIESYKKLREHSRVPISGCEVLTRRQSFLPWIVEGAVDYIQPDVTKVGGISDQHKIAWYAYDHGVECIPHGWNTAVGLAADLQMVSAIPTAHWVEYMVGNPYIDDLWLNTPKIDSEGYLDIPNRPGIGVEWNYDGIEKHSGKRLQADY
ncbi:MAG: mandelate racemase/muconate lactonizing enzyme family protein [Planctomycetes bacterium]|nr:mandelate racemase/muconate lactonizing enzyme family protein [Planctomycetota bacterium]